MTDSVYLVIPFKELAVSAQSTRQTTREASSRHDAPSQRDARAKDEARSKRAAQAKHEARANQILDAAATLLQRWGYNKTTIDDIARHAGVAKGTIYLYWKSREDLFVALFAREEQRLGEEIKERIAGDPDSPALRGFIKHSTLAFMHNPLMRAVVLNDEEVLGVWSNRELTSSTFAGRMASYDAFLEFLRVHGVVATDVEPRAQTYVLAAVWMGFLLIDRWMPPGYSFSDEEVAEMLAATVERALAPRTPGADGAARTIALRAITEALNRYIDQEIEALEALQEEAAV